MRLSEAMEDPSRRRAILIACEGLVTNEVSSKRGLSGVALKTGFKAFRSVRPDMLPRAIERLIPHFLPVIEQHWSDARDLGPSTYFEAHCSQIADELLAVTDRIATRASNRIVVGTYQTLRGRARHHVMAAVPKIPAVIGPHLPATSS